MTKITKVQHEKISQAIVNGENMDDLAISSDGINVVHTDEVEAVEVETVEEIIEEETPELRILPKEVRLSIKEKVINWFLKKDNMVAVPEDWPSQYIDLARKNVKADENIRLIVSEYNKLLEELGKRMTIKDLRDELKNAGLDKQAKENDRNKIEESWFAAYAMDYVETE